MKFRKKPVVIEAMQFDGDNYSEIRAFVGVGQYFKPDYFSGGSLGQAQLFDDVIHEAWLPVRIGQWIVKGVQGEFYPCDPEVFKATYEAA